MIETRFECPNCRSYQGGNIVSVVPYDMYCVSCFIVCRRCHRGATAFCQVNSSLVGTYGRNVIADVSPEIFQRMHVEAIYPQPPKPRLIHALPGNVAGAYRDGEEHLASRHFRSSVASYRTALERAIRNLDADGVTSNERVLYRKIEKFAESYAIPSSLLELMHRVRVFGNDIHEDEDPTDEEAQLASACATLLLTYIYELPARVEEAKAHKDKASAASA